MLQVFVDVEFAHFLLLRVIGNMLVRLRTTSSLVDDVSILVTFRFIAFKALFSVGILYFCTV